MFRLTGTNVPMLGREGVLQRLLRGVAKPAHQHLQVVGPRFAGKTIVLRELAKRVISAPSPYTGVLTWDLGHQTPETNVEFMQQFSRELAAAVASKHPAFVDDLRNPTGNPYHDIAGVLELLSEEGGKVLAILDGFDKPLSNGRLTRTLWDQMRVLAEKPALCIVTSSRKTLRELILHPDAQTSDFWNIFDPTPIRIGPFDDADMDALLAKMPDLSFKQGARTELLNATNGFPVMVLEVLNTLIGTRATGGDVDATEVVRACEEALPVLHDKIGALWLDCSSTCQDLFLIVRDQGPVSRAGIGNADIEALHERGFAQHVGNRLQRASRLVCLYLDGQGTTGTSLARLFGTTEGYQHHLVGVLERRTAQLEGLDASLRRFLERAARDLPEDPKIFMTNVRGIVDQVFELIWKAELPQSRRLPSNWMDVWKRNGERRVEEWETTFPQGVHRLHLLNLMTGTDRSLRCAKYVTKSTQVLMNGVHAFGDFGQHQEGAPIDLGTAYAALHLCIELAASVTRELPAAS